MVEMRVWAIDRHLLAQHHNFLCEQARSIWANRRHVQKNALERSLSMVNGLVGRRFAQRLTLSACTMLLVATLLSVGCPPPPPRTADRVTPNVPGLQPGDLQHCADKMARDMVIMPLLQRSDPPVRIGIASIENHTNEPFVGGSADMVAQRIQTLLHRALKRQNTQAGGAAKFIVTRESLVRQMERQREAKRAGEVTHRGLKDKHGIDYLLSGVYHALDKRDGGVHIVEMLMTFDLTDAETGELAWTNDYLVKTVTR